MANPNRPYDNVHHYKSLHDFVERLKQPASSFPDNRAQALQYINRYGGIEGIEKLWITVGWKEGVAKMRDALEKLEPPQVKDLRRKPRWRDQGDELDLDRLYAGNLDQGWRTTERLSRVAPVPVRITVDIEAHVDVHGGGMFWRGACSVLLAEALALHGYPVQCVVTSGAMGMGKSHKFNEWNTIIVKDFDGPAVLPAMVACLSHESMLRGGIFCHNTLNCPDQCYGADRFGNWTPSSWGYLGYSVDTAGEEPLTTLGMIEPRVRTISVPRMTVNQELAQKWVYDKVAELESERGIRSAYARA